MSIVNKIKLFFLSFMLISNLLPAMQQFPLNVIEGGIPVVDSQVLIEEGIRAGNAQMLRQAWEHYENSMAASGVGSGYLEMGQIYYNLSLLGQSTDEEFAKSEYYINKALTEDPESADAHRAMGLILAGRGAYLDALEELSFALNLNPGNQLLICDIAALHLTLHQPKKTIELLEGKNHSNGWTYVVLAMAWMQQNQSGKAILNLLKAKKLGYSGYWVNTMLEQLSNDLNLPLVY